MSDKVSLKTQMGRAIVSHIGKECKSVNCFVHQRVVRNWKIPKDFIPIFMGFKVPDSVMRRYNNKKIT